MSLPPRGAWIEILTLGYITDLTLSSLPPRGAWIEMIICGFMETFSRSLPPRGAWIEITYSMRSVCDHNVAPPTGSVD